MSETATITPIRLADLPMLGQPLAGGSFVGLTTKPDGTHAAVVLLADKPASELKWPAAMDWAAEVGGELPSRPVAALLFANARAAFEPEWHWTNEVHEHDSSYAWCQSFGGGGQYDDHKSYEGRARAVRQIQLIP